MKPPARRYAVVGGDARHSLSPRIFAAFARATQIPLFYAVLFPRPDFESAARRFFAGGGRGINVTIPFKPRAAAFAAKQSAQVARCGCANALVVDGDGAVAARNTDGAGLVADVGQNRGFALAGRRILLLGAGGAARGIAPALAARSPAAIFVCARDDARGRETAAVARAAAVDVEIKSGVWGDALEADFDLIINTLPGAATADDFAFLRPQFARAALALDISYGAGLERAAFLRAARAGGAREIADGLGMLVEQAALTFALWEGTMPATARLRADLRRDFRLDV